MKVIAIVSQKGGVGKTTLSINLAVAAEQERFGPAWCADTDPQGSLIRWFAARRAAGHDTPRLLEIPATGLARRVRDLRHERGILFIDTPPAVDARIGSIIGLADIVLVPVRPALLDVEAVGSTIDLYRAHRKADARLVFVLTQAANRSKSIAPVGAALQAHSEVCPHVVYSRIDYQDSLHGGSSVIEADPWGKSANEIRGVLSIALQPTEPVGA